ncbi:hypothetical protein MPSEU_000137100 [Mayamaea pseudoterrestris]|nr:hypothetical protein MPSEU_000137100 [Mayamaea pseudoterrestris]
MLVTSLINQLPPHANALLLSRFGVEHGDFIGFAQNAASWMDDECIGSSSNCIQTLTSVIKSSIHPSLLLSLSATDSSSTEFAPVLNIPALISFVVVALAFVSLQIRVTSIGDAADRRTDALKALRTIKSLQLEGKATTEQVDEALRKYEQTFSEVEQLRNVLPGVRIRPPPVTAGLAQTRMKENEAAAKQFLGIEPTAADVEENDINSEKGNGRLALPLVAILVLVLISQMGLLMLLANDPMSSSMDPTMTTTEILDAISNLE